jgi:hypothetical protein
LRRWRLSLCSDLLRASDRQQIAPLRGFAAPVRMTRLRVVPTFRHGTWGIRLHRRAMNASGHIYIALPIMIIWGWIRWAMRRRLRTAYSRLSLIGFALSTLSALLAIGSVLYAHAIGGFRYYDPTLLRIYRGHRAFRRRASLCRAWHVAMERPALARLYQCDGNASVLVWNRDGRIVA